MEKDELLGTTLILAWVPNSRIQRQDEEALRYVTPESSPVRKAPRKRGRHAQGFGAAQQASPTEPKGAVILKEDILTVSQLVKDGAYISSPSLDGEKLPRAVRQQMVPTSPRSLPAATQESYRQSALRMSRTGQSCRWKKGWTAGQSQGRTRAPWSCLLMM